VSPHRIATLYFFLLTSLFFLFFSLSLQKLLTIMKIGTIDLGDRPVMLAPMEDVTDASFRLICKEMGADMTYTEFVSADALIRNIAATTRKLEINPGERPTAIQIYGREVEPMVEAARIVEAAKPDILDINFGCPVKKVAGKGAGAGMLRDVPRMLEITRAVVNAVNIPVTVKTRLGWDCNSQIIVELAEQLQDCGIQALTVHGRTRSQMYTGSADWTMIARVKENPRLHIPVIGNGDIVSAEGAREAFDKYGVDGVMVGRASIGAPWIFHDIKAGLASADGSFEPLSLAERFALLHRQIRESVERIDEYRGILHVRRHLAASPLFKGIASFRETRIAMLRANTLAELEEILTQVEARLSAE
jgi:nifR3 family TIM-barrel protein